VACVFCGWASAIQLPTLQFVGFLLDGLAIFEGHVCRFSRGMFAGWSSVSIGRMMNRLMSREGRKWLYGIALTVVPLLVAYGVIEESAGPLWIALIGSIVAPSLALTHLTPDLPPPGEDRDEL